tara:strand:+ start:277 stop:555 length:279 start_codon:yes stop_codon:yes gene_type:complete
VSNPGGLGYDRASLTLQSVGFSPLTPEPVIKECGSTQQCIRAYLKSPELRTYIQVFDRRELNESRFFNELQGVDLRHEDNTLDALRFMYVKV